MKRALFIIAAAILSCGIKNTFAQTRNTKIAFHSQNQVAIINGNGAVSAALQSVNGISFNRWFAGLGAGLDFYRYRSIPVFADVKRYFGIRNGNDFFIYGDGGYNFPWIKQANDQLSIWSWPSKTDSKYTGGAYMDAGAGYAIHFKNGNAFLLSIGFSHKYFSEKQTVTNGSGGIVAGDAGTTTDTRRYTYSFNRIMIKAGWQF